MYTLGLNNTPRISFKLVKSRIKNIRPFKQGASRCKMVGAGFQCIALTPRSNSADCHNKNNCLAISSQSYCGLPNPALRPNMNPVDGSDLWQSALKCRLLTLAIRSTAIFIVAIRRVHAAVCQYRVKHLSAEFRNV
jgi:hypothetical protein